MLYHQMPAVSRNVLEALGRPESYTDNSISSLSLIFFHTLEKPYSLFIH